MGGTRKQQKSTTQQHARLLQKSDLGFFCARFPPREASVHLGSMKYETMLSTYYFYFYATRHVLHVKH